MVSRPTPPPHVREQAVSLVEVLRNRAASEGSKVAFRFIRHQDSNVDTLTYAQLDQRARTIAGHLQSRFQPNDRVMLLFPPGLDYVAAFMGCLYAGMVAVPLYPPRPNQKLYRAGLVISDAAPVAALTNSATLSTVETFFATAESLASLPIFASDSLEKEGSSWTPLDLTANHLAFLQYTSGSTGTPKGVMVSHGNIVANAATMVAAGNVTSADIAVSWLPIYHDMGLIGMVLEAIYAGFTTLLMPSADFVRDPIWWLELISQHGATISGGPNFGYELCCDRISAERLEGLDLSRWRIAFNGAEPVRAETLRRFADTFAPAGFHSNAFFPCYGMAETTLFISACAHDSQPVLKRFDADALTENLAHPSEDEGEGAQLLVGCGRTYLTDQIAIADGQGFALEQGQVGEIWVQSTGKAQGYWNQPELSKEIFQARLRNNPDRGTFLRTGDLGFLFQGEVYVTGRLKDLLIIRGRNHYPQDLERTAERAHPALAANASAAFTVERDGLEHLVLALEIKRTEARKFDSDEVFQAIRTAISEGHELAVHDIVLLKPGRIPKTSSGKIQRRATKAKYDQNQLDVIAHHAMSIRSVHQESLDLDRETLLQSSHPTPLIARQLHQWVASALGIDPASFTTQSPLTSLGMSSMAAISLQHQVEQAWRIKLPLASLLTGQAIDSLAAFCAQAFVEPEPQKTQAKIALPSRFPLSPNQRALWNFLNLNPESTAYNLPYAVRLRMPLDVDALKTGFATLWQRHRMLRATVAMHLDQPEWVINGALPLPFEIHDARSWSETQIQAFIDQAARASFDLERGPLFRITCLTCGEEETVLFLNMSHLIGDMWSLLVLLDEMRQLYSSRESQILLEPVQRDFSEWAAMTLAFGESAEGQKQWTYWQDRLSGEIPSLDLPIDRPRPPRQTTSGQTFALHLGEALHQKLHQLARQAGVTPSTLFLASFQTLLHRYTAQDRVLVGVPFNSRQHKGFEKTLGYFINPLPIVSDFAGHPSFVEFLEQTKKAVSEAISHGDLPFQTLLTRLNLARDPSRTPLFQAMFAYQEPHQVPGAGALAVREAGVTLGWGEFHLESMNLDPGFAQFDLTLLIADLGKDTVAKFEYNSDLFKRETLQHLADHWREFLVAIVQHSKFPLRRLSAVSSGDHQLLDRFQKGIPAEDFWRPVHEAFLSMAELHPSAPALVDGAHQISYASLAQRAKALAHTLRAQGVGPETIVGLCFHRCPELVEAALGVMLAGGAYVPMDPGYPSDRLVRMVGDSGMKKVLCHPNHVAKLPANDVEIMPSNRWHDAEVSVPGELPGILNGEQTAYVIYTSGSTGQPKGVAIPHRGLANLVAWHMKTFGLGSQDRSGLTAGPGFDASVWEIWPTLASGGALHILPTQLSSDPEGLRDWILQEALSVTFLATPLAEAVLHAKWPQKTSLRYLLTGGDKLHAPPSAQLPFTLVNNYGPTENSVVATSALLTHSSGQPPIGRPIHGVATYVLTRQLDLAPIGAAGELCLSGASQARGYLNNARETAAAFLPNPLAENLQHNRLYRTGDLVRFDRHGMLHFLGRIDQQVKLRGFRIELGDIETALTQIPGIEDALVVLQKEAHETRLVAYTTGVAPAPSELREALAQTLPSYMVPGAFVALPAFPLTPNGKIDRRALPAPSRQHFAVSSEVTAPRNPLEAKLCEIWRDVLPAADQIGIHDNFFELGGDSILAIQIVTKARQADLHLTPGDVFNHQTVASLALVANQERKPIYGTDIVEGPVTPTAIQQWFLESQQPDPAHFNQSVLLEIESGLSLNHLHQALDLLHQHHDALRLRFDIQGMAPIHHAPSASALVTEQAVDSGRIAEQVMATTQTLQTGLNLKHGPLVAACLFRTPDTHADLLFLTIHHLVVDGISWRILLEDLSTLLKGLRSGNTPHLPAKTTSLAAWSSRIRQERGSVSYWQTWPKGLNGAQLPGAQSIPAEANTVSQTVSHGITLKAAAVQELTQKAAALYRVGPQEILLTALLRALAGEGLAWEGVIDVESHGREQALFEGADLSRTVGWFTALYPVRFALAPEAGAGDDLLAVKEQLRAVPHGGVFFDADRVETPKTHISFNYLGRFEQALQPPFLNKSSLPNASDRADSTRRRHSLEIDAILLPEGLQIDFTYGQNQLSSQIFEKFVKAFQAQIQVLVEHCHETTQRRWSPADFAYAQIKQGELDTLQVQHPELVDMYPLSPVQEGMLFHALYGENPAAYFEQLTCRFEGSLEPEAFRCAWTDMVRHVGVLATGFAWEHLATPLQWISANPSPEWHFRDVSDMVTSDQNALILTFLNEDRERGFDLANPPLTRFALFRTSATQWTFVWSYHHLLMDGWSMGLVLEEVLSHYRALVASKPYQYRQRAPFRNFVAHASQQTNDDSKAYWRKALAGFNAPLVLPMQRNNPGEVAHLNRSLPAHIVTGLEILGKSHGLTLSTCVQGALAILLGRYARTDDVVFGLTVSGRESGETQFTDMVGLLINTVPVRAHVPLDATLGTWLKALQGQALEREPHAGMPLAKIQACSDFSGGKELFDTLLVVENYPLHAESLHRGLGFEVTEVHAAAYTHYGLTVVARAHDGLQFQIAYDSGKFRKESVTRLLGHLETLLAAMPQALETPLLHLPLLTGQEALRLTQDWNHTEKREPVSQGIHAFFEAQAALTPDREAVYLPAHTLLDGSPIPEQRLTYAQLNHAANHVAHDLRARGVGAESLVGLYVERSLELVVGLLGILKAGGAYVPLDPAYPADRLTFMMADAGLDWVLCQPGMQAQLAEHAGKAIEIQLSPETFAPNSNPVPLATTPQQTAYIIYTSGSTGKPKGVPVTHSNVVRLFQTSEALFGFNRNDVWTLFHSYAFDFTVWELWGALIYGGKLVIVPQIVARSADAFHALLCDQQVTVLNQTPSAFVRLIQADERSPHTCDSLRYVIFGGEALEPRSLQPWYERYGDRKPQLINMYGITETTVHVTFCPISLADCQRGGSNLGVRLPDLSLYLLDPAMQAVPLGVQGEIFVGGAGVARGYLHRPSLTAQRFLPDPFSQEPGARLYRSGDLGRFREPEHGAAPSLEYAGRCDFQVKIRGFRIELGEIETALMAIGPVRDAVVLAREDIDGISEKQLVAYLTGNLAAIPPAAEMHELLRANLPDYMIPSHFVLLEDLPLTAHGKVDRAKLPIPSRVLDEADDAFVAPRTPLEKELAKIWTEVLDLEKVGIQQRFFELGGDSILSIRVMTAAKRAGLSFTLPQLFKLQTIEKLAEVTQTLAAPAGPTTLAAFSLIDVATRGKLPVGIQDAYPATLLQKGMLFHSEREKDAYHNLTSFHLAVPFDEAQLRNAVAAVIERHPVLRTAFDLSHYAEPLQLVYAHIETPVYFHDWREMDEIRQAKAFDAWFEKEKQTHFDWTKPGLLRFHFHRRSNSQFQVTLTEHHAILDGWSVASLLSEVFGFYFSFTRSKYPAPAPMPKASFADFVALERQTIARGESGRFWADHLDSFEFTRIPRLPGEDDGPAHLDVEVDSDLSEKLLTFANDLGVPIKSVFLAVHFRMLALLSGTRDLLTGLVANGRPEDNDSERVQGLFLNTLPLRLNFHEHTWRELVGEVFALEQAALPHRRYPLAEIQKMFGGKPLFETAFNYTHFHVYQSVKNVEGLEVLNTRFHAPTHIPFATNFSRDLETGRVLLSLDYRSEVFPHRQMAAVGEHFLTAMRHLVRYPDASAEQVRFLSAQDQTTVLREWNRTHVLRPVEPTGLHQLVSQQALRTPSKTAVVKLTPDGIQSTLTYRELERQSSQLAQLLIARGAQPDQPIGLCLRRSPQTMVAMLAVLKAGCGYLPLDPAYPDDRLAFMLQDSAATLVIVEAEEADRLALICDAVNLDALDEELASFPQEDPAITIHPEQMAYIIYTSGSTGTPKGVVISHGAILNQIYWRQQCFPFTADDRLLQNLSLSFDPSVWQIFWPLSLGAQLFLIPNNAQRDIPWLAQMILEHKLSATAMVPSILRVLLEQEAFLNSHHLKHISCGGEGLPADLVTQFCQHFGEDGILHVVYGPTEATIDASTWHARTKVPTKIAPIGFPIHNAQLYVLDSHMEPVPPGVPGELFIAGTGLGRGYLQRPGLTAERYLPNPFDADGTRLYRSGDLVRYLEDGLLEFLGRVDHQVKVRGFRIELGELEAMLSTHPAVQEVACIVREDQPGEKRLVAYLKGSLEGVSLRNWLAEQVPDYMVPAVFVHMDEFPRLPNDKINRQRLPEPEASDRQNAAAFVAPRSETEIQLAAIWSGVLGLETLGIHDNFFELGGDSILSLQIIARAREAGFNLSPKDLFDNQTIAALAQVVNTKPKVQAEQGPVTGLVPLTPVQHWFAAKGSPNHFNQSVVLTIPLDFHAQALQTALNALCDHHDVLRITWNLDQSGEVRQSLTEPGLNVPLTVLNFNGPEDEWDLEIAAHAGFEQIQFNLDQPPLLRAILFQRFEGNTHRGSRIFLVAHHLVIDGVSWRFLLEDLRTLYQQGTSAKAAQLPAKTTSFKAWAETQQNLAQSEEILAELGLWDSVSHDGSAPAFISGPAEKNTVANAKTESLTLDSERTHALLRKVPGVYQTRIDEVLLTAMALAWKEWSQGSDLHLDLESHGRSDAYPEMDLSRTVGWFTAAYPMRIKVADPSPGEALKAVKEQVRRIPKLGLSFGLLRYLNPETQSRLSQLPQAPVAFNYLGQLDENQGQEGFALLDIPTGTAHDPNLLRSYLIECNGFVKGGRLQMQVTWPTQLLDKKRAEDLVSRFQAQLENLIDHCLTAQAGGRTPVDYPLVDLSQDEVNDLVEQGFHVEEVLPLAPSQQDILFHVMFGANNLFHQQLHFVIEQPLDLPRFQAAWAQAVSRHAALRASFHGTDLEHPVQVIHRQVVLPWDLQDWRHIAQGQLSTHLDAYLMADRGRPFDVTQPPLMRLALMQLGPDRFQFVWSHHHLLSDGWSLPLILQDVLATYLNPQNAPLQTPVKPFRDYLAWMRQQDHDALAEWWKNHLQGFTEATPLPMDRLLQQEPQTQSHQQVAIRFSSEDSAALTQFTRSHRLTLNTLVQGAWAAVLARYNDRQDVVFGASVSGRPHDLPGVEAMVGLFINTLPVRIILPETQPILEWLHQVQDSMRDMERRSATPAAAIRANSAISGDKPLYESIVVFENYPVDASLREQGFAVDNFQVVEQTNFPLALTAEMSGDQLNISLTYHTERFLQNLAEQILEHLVLLIQQMVQKRVAFVGELSLVAPSNRDRCLALGMGPKSPIQPVCFHHLFEIWAKKTPDALAIMAPTQSGPETLTYAQLEHRANAFARVLLDSGVKPGSYVGIHIEKSTALPVAILGVLKVGAAYVPLDPDYPQDRLLSMAEQAGLRLLLSSRSLAGSLPLSNTPLLIVDELPLEDLPGLPVKIDVSPELPAYLIFSSGSTGKPKGITICHRGYVNAAQAWEQTYQLSTSVKRHLQMAAFSFDVFPGDMARSLTTGGALVFCPKTTLMDPEKLWNLIVEYQVDAAEFVPAVMRELRGYLLEKGLSFAPFRLLVLGADSWSVAEALQLKAMCGPQTRLYNSYGVTEATIDSTFLPTHALPYPPNRTVPIGKAFDNTDLYILDHRLNPLPIGVFGTLYLGGPNLALNYHGQPAATAEKFVPNPYSGSGERLYCTNDAARFLPSGDVDFLGRIDNQVKIRGLRVELGEIEAVIAAHPQIDQAIVLLRKDAPQGLGHQLVGYVLANQTPDFETLKKDIRKQLPDYMVPNFFVQIERMPLTPNGKIDRRGFPVPQWQNFGSAFVVPQTATERAIAEIWTKVLGIETPSADANFFDMGGHSLLATRIVALVRKTFKRDLPLRDFFENATIAKLAELIDGSEANQEISGPELVPVDAEPIMSFGQKRLWFIEQMSGPSGAYNLAFGLRLRGELNLEALEQAFLQMLRRHQSLRTRIHEHEGQALISHGPAPESLILPLEDLSGNVERENLAAARFNEAAAAAFDLQNEPLLRLKLLKLDPQDHLLVVVKHHIISDAWSIGVMIRELSELYAAQLQQREPMLPDLPLQYADFAHWQKSYLSDGRLDTQLAWWKNQLQDAPQSLALPFDRPRPALRTTPGASIRFHIPSDVVQSIRGLAAETNTTLFMNLIGAYAALLGRYSFSNDVVIGTPIANRTRAELEPMIGFFVNTLALRLRFDNASWRRHLDRIRNMTLDAYAHQDLPFERLVEALDVPRDLSHEPVFQVMFTLQNALTDALTLPGLDVSTMMPATQTARFDMLLILEESANGLIGIWEYNSDLFDAQTIQTMVAQYRQLLTNLYLAPDQPLTHISLLSPSQIQTERALLQAPDTPLAVPDSLVALVEAQVARAPEQIALTTENRSYSYAEVNHLANQLAHLLALEGIRPGMPVAISGARTAMGLIGQLAIIKAGGWYVPIDPQLPEERQQWMLAETRASLLLCADEESAVFAALGLPMLHFTDPRLETLPTQNPNLVLGKEATAYVMFTSGSTGKPKGVVIPHRGILSLVQQLDYTQIDTGDGVLHFASPAFDANTFEVWAPLVRGGRICMFPQGPADVPALANFIQVHQISVMFLTSGFFNRMVEHGLSQLSGVKYVLTGGEALSRSHAATFLKTLPQCTLINIYGPTESTTFATCQELSLVDVAGRCPIGKAIAHRTTQVLSESLTLAAPMEVGELCLGGAGIANGYLHRPALTAERFIPHPFASTPGARLYRTGDLVYRNPRGAHVFCGRNDGQVKIRGFRIELGEIEHHLLQHPSIHQAAVLVRQDLPGGKGLVAFLETTAEGYSQDEIDVSSLSNFLRKALPDYMVPSVFIELAALPLNRNGKVDRASLFSHPLEGRLTAGHEFIEPQSPTELQLAAIWSELLGLEQVGIHDNFFEAGGHSLLATQILSRIRKQFQIEAPLRELFEKPTIALLAPWIERQQTQESLPPITACTRDTNPVLSFAQQRLWFLDQMDVQSGKQTGTYNIHASLKLDGVLDSKALFEAVHNLVLRHEALRTNFAEANGKPVQIIHPQPTVVLERVDATSLSAEDLTLHMQTEAERGFNLAQDALLRLTLLRQSPTEHLLLLTMHHIISDGWSMGILVGELLALYREACALGSANLVPLPIQYADYANWQHTPEVVTHLEKQAEWWRNQLSHLPECHQVPTDRPRPAVQTHAGRHFQSHAGKVTLDQAQALAHKHEATLFMVLLATFKVLLARYSDQEDLAVGTPIANRNRAEVEPLIGFFVNTLVLRTRLDRKQSFSSLLQSVKQTALDAFAHQDVPFEQVVDAVHPQRSLSHSPLFQIMFALQNQAMVALEMEDLSLTPLPAEVPVAKFDLTLDMRTNDEGLIGVWEYNTDLFNASTIQTMAQHFNRLLEALLADPEQPIGAVSFLTESERSYLLQTSSQTQRHFPLERGVHRFFEEQAALRPHQPALIFQDPDSELSYADLNQRANQIAWTLLKAGVGQGTCVALLIDRSWEMIAGILGVLKAGAAYLPLDPDYPEQRLAYLLEDSQASLILTHTSLLERCGDKTALCLDQPQAFSPQTHNPDVPVLPYQAAYYIYTSGSTGLPKASINTHRGLANHNLWLQERFPLEVGDRMALKTPFSFDVSAWETFWPLMVGASIAVAAPGRQADLFYLREWMQDQGVTVAYFVASMLAAFVDSLEDQVFDSRLRLLFTGGESLTPDVQQRAFHRLRHQGKPLAIQNTYGPSEAAISCSHFDCGSLPQTDAIPIGKPIANMAAYVVDANLNLVPQGIPGELVIAGVNLSHGYHRRAALSADKFVPNPFSESCAGDRLYRTGDLVRMLPSGDVRFLGRVDAQVKLRGMRIELGEIETALQQHPAVDAALVLVQSAVSGTQNLVAFLQHSHSTWSDLVESIRAELRQTLPGYMLPGFFVPVTDWPRLPSGKLDRNALKLLAVDVQQEARTIDYVAPRNDIETTLCQIWQEVLGIEKVGVLDNFFEIGGHSLLATQVLSRIRNSFPEGLSLQFLFEEPTVAGIAKGIENIRKTTMVTLDDEDDGEEREEFEF